MQPATLSAPASHARLLPVFAAFIVMLVLAALDQTILATALPAISRELHGSDRLSWVFSAYLMAATVVVPLYGRLADMHGSKPLLLLATALFLGGSLACGMSDSMTMLILARGVQGAGGGGLMTLTLLGVADLVPLERRAAWQSTLGASYGLATMFGPLIGATLVQHLSWHWAFLINLPFALLALAIIAWRMPRAQPRPAQGVDLPGALLLAASLVALLLATRRDAEATAARAGLLMLLGAGLAALFLWRQQRAAHPILSLALFERRDFSVATLLSGAAGVALFSAVVFLPVFLQTALAKSPIASAWHLLPLMAGITAGAVGTGRRLRGDGRMRARAMRACAAIALAFSALAAVLWLAPSSPLLLSACLLPLGLGIGSLFPLVTVMAQRSAPPQFQGVATSTPIMLRSLGGALGVSALGALFAHRIAAAPMAQGLPVAFAGALLPVYLLTALLGLLAWALARRWPSHVPQPTG